MLTKEIASNIKIIAQSIDALNLTEQLSLLEYIAHQIRIKNELVVMAQDPQIQAELSQIQKEFSVTEFDGFLYVLAGSY
jgi:heme oxygenase